MSDASATSLIPPKCQVADPHQLPKNGDNNLFPIDELEILDDQIVDILTQIEQEHNQMTVQEQPKERQNVLNVSNISNVQNAFSSNKPSVVPAMYFRNSTNITINYHIQN